MKEENEDTEFKPLSLDSPTHQDLSNESHSLPQTEEPQSYNYYNYYQQPMEIDHKAEAIKANFMPASVLLERKQIDINEVIDNRGNTLLHYAAMFSYQNVMRTLLELFHADINIKNAEGMTPLHIVCSNKLKDYYLLSYLIQIENINFDIEDNKGYTPLTYTVINNFSVAFYTLLSFNCDIRHKDKEGNTLYYHAIINDNLTVMKFLIEHGQPLESSLNKKTLSDVLIQSKGEKCCKYLLKYYSEEKLTNIKMNNIESCLLPLAHFSTGYNLKNYQMLNAFYKYSTTNVFAAILFTIFSNKMIEHRLYCITYLFIHKLVYRTPKLFKRWCIFLYSIISCVLFSVLYLYLSGSKITFNLNLLFALYQLSTIGFIIYSSYRLFMTHTPSKLQNFYSEKKKINDESNLIVETKKQMTSNIFEVPKEYEGCPICLIKKDVRTVHCNKCKKCVCDFYFHSNVLDMCISKANLSHYMIITSCIWFIHFSLIGQFTDVVMPDAISDYAFANIYYFFSRIGLIGDLLILYLLLSGILMLGLTIELIVCKGSDVTYYLMFNAHKIPYGKIEQRDKDYVNIPMSNLIKIKEFALKCLCG